MGSRPFGPCLARIGVVEKALVITSPRATDIKQIYETIPPAREGTLTPMSFIHGWTLTSHTIIGGLRRRLYTVRSQLWTGNNDADDAARVAAAFADVWLDAFADDLTLNGACTGPIVIRGDSPTLARLEFAGAASIGLSLLMDIPINDDPVVGG